jgi:hypothetical protein
MLRRAGLLALTALLLPAAAGTATADAAKRKKPHSPVVKKVAPKHVFVGETLTIYGRYFRRGVNKNTVAFKRKGEKVVFVKAEKGTTKLLKVTLPKRLEKALVVQNGTPVPTRLQIRVLAARFGKRFTKLSLSPIVGPEKPPAPPRPPEADPNGDCDGDHQLNRVDADDDNDLLGDELEKQLKLDACKADTDGDGVSDGYEYFSARDLNDDEHQDPNAFLPYPEKRPYPNALDGTDAGTDHDGDSLTLKEEYDLWRVTGSSVPMSYSAGEQYSVSARAGGTGRRMPALAADGYAKQAEFLAWASQTGYATVGLSGLGNDWWDARTPYNLLDMDRSGGVSAPERLYYDNGNGYLDDGERDEDADGLTNFAETRGCTNREYWNGLYKDETPFPRQYGATSLVDADSDGDGVRDGADDQDFDDVPNVMECSRTLAADLPPDPLDATNPRVGLPDKGFVNPFNPCLPHTRSRTCPTTLPLDNKWAPFNPDDKYYFIWN